MTERIFFRILRYLAPYKRQFIFGSLFAFLFSIANGLTLYSIVPVFDTLTPGSGAYQIRLSREETEILKKKPLQISEQVRAASAQLKTSANSVLARYDKFSVLIFLCSGLLAIIVIRIILELCTIYYIAAAGNAAIRDLRQDIHRSLIASPLDAFHNQKTGDIISRCIYDTDQISGAITNQLRKFIVNLFIVATHLALLLYLNPALTAGAMVMLVGITLPILGMGRLFKKYSLMEQTSAAAMSSLVVETVAGIRIIKSYLMEKFQLDRFTEQADLLCEKTTRKAMLDIARPHLVETIASLFAAFLFVYGGARVIDGDYTRGEFLFFVLTFLFLMNPLKQIADMNNQVKQSETAGERIFQIIDRQPEYATRNPERENRLPVDANGSGTMPVEKPDAVITPSREIRFDRVSFTYATAASPALCEINFTARPGQTIAIVGRSGSGKTTLLDLLGRFYHPSSGSISIDGTDIRDIPLPLLRRSIGVVTQDVFLFNGSIAQNIGYGRTDITDEQIRQAARMANAHDFITRTPDGYDTHIGERGIMLSGGERQRIAIARSILRNPPILVLDEATSSLDGESERLVEEALNRLMHTRTTFVIAHRLSTVQSADVIVVLEQGRIVESGDHRSLLAHNGTYRRLVEIQA